MEDTAYTVGKTIKFLRRKYCVPKAVLARDIGCTPESIYNWENGITIPQSYYLPLIADRFHVSIDYLFGRWH